MVAGHGDPVCVGAFSLASALGFDKKTPFPPTTPPAAAQTSI